MSMKSLINNEDEKEVEDAFPYQECIKVDFTTLER